MAFAFGIDSQMEDELGVCPAPATTVADLSLDEADELLYAEQQQLPKTAASTSEQRSEYRRERNRESARVWRERQKEELAELSEQLQTLSGELAKLRLELALARAEAAVLRTAASDFRIAALFVQAWSRGRVAVVGTPPDAPR